ncbi:hypothetical protein [Leifsonia poae]|uniref:hypothetical protein n=1 Tax=Leifsonia poae TaxID=110933 RepID=UPI003D66DA25
MMITTQEPPPDARVLSESDALDLAARIVGSAIREQLWALFLGEDDRPARLAIPIEGLPDRPTDDLVERTAATVGEVLRMLGGGSVILVRERPGPPGVGTLDAEWAGSLRVACASAGVSIRGLLLSHDAGVRTLPELRAAT